MTHTALNAHLATIAATPGFKTDPGGSARADIRFYVWHHAHGLCVVCGQATRLEAKPTDADRAEGGHFLPAPGRGGYVAGNLGNMCRACNETARDRDLRPYVARFERSDLIPLEWPTKREMSEMRQAATQGDDRAHRVASRRVTERLGW